MSAFPFRGVPVFLGVRFWHMIPGKFRLKETLSFFMADLKRKKPKKREKNLRQSGFCAIMNTL